MSDARWIDVADDVIEATEHFVKADAPHESGRFAPSVIFTCSSKVDRIR